MIDVHWGRVEQVQGGTGSEGEEGSPWQGDPEEELQSGERACSGPLRCTWRKAHYRTAAERLIKE